jgi:A/G-specific adenine glycosylase
MPWKGEKDPYKVWLSEIILQQTRVEQGLKYYEKFVTCFPNVHALARAEEKKIYKLWEGLGYYSRCRNLIHTARYISTKLKGHFPTRYEELKKLRGIGPYTAAAISSFAFNEPRAVVDGNVFRVLARIFGIDRAIDSTEGKKYFNHLANELLARRKAAAHNQAIMDFGAVICKPIPVCEQCPFNNSCEAFSNDRISLLPVKSKKAPLRKRWLNYILIQYEGEVAVRQRIEKDIWHNLFEFLPVEADSDLRKNQLLEQLKQKGWLHKNGFEVKSVSAVFKQQLSHQHIRGRFMQIQFHRKPKLPSPMVWISEKKIKDYAFPKFINQYLQKG